MESACQSLNYNLADKTCQLNNDTKYFRPRHFVEKETFVYAENPDSGKHCEIIPYNSAHTKHMCINGICSVYLVAAKGL